MQKESYATHCLSYAYIRFGIVLASENHENDLKSVEKTDILYD
jgi:hypothetical protein